VQSRIVDIALDTFLDAATHKGKERLNVYCRRKAIL